MVRKTRNEKHKRSLGAVLVDPATNGVRTQPRRKRIKMDEDSDNEMGVGPVTQELSNAILREARAQRDEVEEEEKGNERGGGPSALVSGALKAALETLENEEDEEEEEEEEDHDDGLVENDFDETKSFAAMEDGVTEEDEKIMNAFLRPDQGSQQKTLADVIMAKLAEKQSDMQMEDRTTSAAKEDAPSAPQGIDPEAAEVFRATGLILSRYRSGKVPKAFRFIPSLKNWEEVLFLTNPEAWTPQAHFLATKMFVSNYNEKMAQRFLNLVLLPKVREYIRENKRCHFMLFEALKRACYKPGAFFKGILLPLCQSGTCSVREAVIFSTLMKKVSLNVLHSAAALLRLAEMEYNGASSFFIGTLLDKKYALPYKVVDGLVQHFMRFEDEERLLPVVWHHALLAFVQRYKFDIKDEEKIQLKRLLKAQCHPLVTPEIHRELNQVVPPKGKSGGQPQADEDMEMD
ncbi:hypothetical protein BSKO_03889 [Bryopsis sp. KO-2023]|nr:hypothetical protein BSKO_03889 [Bryopsis sp. KO-2023]